MELREAWITLGFDPSGVFTRISSPRNMSDKIRAAESEFEQARTIARKLLGIHHPDKNPGDILAAERFRRTTDALRVIEEHTDKFREVALRVTERESNRTFIEVK